MSAYRDTWNFEARRDAMSAIYSIDGGPTPADLFWSSGERDVTTYLIPHAGRDVVEYGCGIGRLLVPFARSVPASSFTGLDVSPEMLARLVAPDNVTTRLVEGRGLVPLPDASVDLVYSFLVLQHMRHHDAFRALTEFRRILRPSGVVIITLPNFASPTYRRDFHTALSVEDLGPGAVRPWTRDLADIVITEVGFTYELLNERGAADFVFRLHL